MRFKVDDIVRHVYSNKRFGRVLKIQEEGEKPIAVLWDYKLGTPHFSRQMSHSPWELLPTTEDERTMLRLAHPEICL